MSINRRITIQESLPSNVFLPFTIQTEDGIAKEKSIRSCMGLRRQSGDRGRKRLKNPIETAEKELSCPYLLFMEYNRTRCEETSVDFLK